LFLLGGARAQEAKKDEPILNAPRASVALGRLEDARKSKDELPQELKSIIIDKPKIAEESAKRAVGLREAGNPHIPSGLLLSHIQDDPTVSRLSEEQVRQEQIRRIERREPLPEAKHSPAEAQGSAPMSAARRGKQPPQEEGLSLGLMAICGSFVLLAVGIIFYLKRN